ncbi:MAG: hypothetical protein EOO27_08900 [Comamonadaceae bacterium]|nr:MAG: hypothetical protein EOO27_08900 [Comamonadaceae bacterium]
MNDTKKMSKAELLTALAEAGEDGAAKLRRLTNAELAALLAAKVKPTKTEAAKPSVTEALDRVCGLLGLTLGEVVEMSAYSRAAATAGDGRRFTLYRNAKNVGVVPKGLASADARGVLTEFQTKVGGTLRASKAELLISDLDAS